MSVFSRMTVCPSPSISMHVVLNVVNLSRVVSACEIRVY